MPTKVPGFEHFHHDGLADITRKSGISGRLNTRTLPVTFEQFTAFERGTMVQDAFPHLSADDREFILTGITPQEWEETFGDNE